MSVIGDPQISALRQRVVNVGGRQIGFGFIWEPYRAVWPAKFGQGGMSEAAIGFLRKFDVPTQYNAERAAARVVGRRFAAMMSFLSAGHIVAEGIPRGGGAAVAVPRSLWQRSETHIDLENGDIIEMNRHADDHTTALSKPIFTGLMLQRPAAPSLPSVVQKQTLTPETTASFDNKAAAIITKTTSRDACKLWLCRLMTESPVQRPKAKREFWQEARSKWPNSLAERAFNKAWDDAVETSGAVIWSAGGRPKKPSQSKPPHE
ncbi:hypothetical protein [Tardiphaga robiniae]|uniref:Uncharacterized protein n=1 Tax=Tardiphaga robiniae TaxID=943830 RepID=A0A7G6U3R6_9BRAD|nr:hypothetical protein [Tardiphaga robiniae]QND73648.1 hypothetical protein HB776_22425 [Tardiphaga robiniae]